MTKFMCLPLSTPDLFHEDNLNKVQEKLDTRSSNYLKILKVRL